MESFLPKHPSVIAETMRKVEDAIAEVKVLQNMQLGQAADDALRAAQLEIMHRGERKPSQWGGLKITGPARH